MTDGERATVVYVEDDAGNFRLVCRVLESTGKFRVLRATDGVAGFELVAKEKPQIALLDIDIPLLNGLEVARKIRQDPNLSQTPLLAVSANVMRGEREACLDAGFDAFVEKPFDILKFRALVIKLIEAREKASDTD